MEGQETPNRERYSDCVLNDIYRQFTGNSQAIIMMKNANFFVFQLFASGANCVCFCVYTQFREAAHA